MKVLMLPHPQDGLGNESGIRRVVEAYHKHLLPVTPDGPHPKPWEGVNRAVDDLLLGKYEQVLQVDSLIAFRVK